MPTMETGDILGHEPMGDVVEVGSGVTKLKKGDRVVVPFTISCGTCLFCKRTVFSLCDTSNPNAEDRPQGDGPLAGRAVRLLAHARRLRRRPGRVPARARTPTSARSRSSPDLPDEKVLFLSDIFPTGYMAAENAEIEPGDTVAVWGCGPVGAVRHPERLDARRRPGDRHRPRAGAAGDGREHGKAETINFDEEKVYDRLMEMTKGRGPDRCIDAVGCEAHAGGSVDAVLDKAKAAVMLATDRAHVLREAIMCCRKGGTISVPGVYVGFLDKIPFGALMNKGLTMKTGQTHVQRYTAAAAGEDRGRRDRPVVRHHPPRSSSTTRPAAYKTFRDKKDGCIKVVLKP